LGSRLEKRNLARLQVSAALRGNAEKGINASTGKELVKKGRYRSSREGHGKIPTPLRGGGGKTCEQKPLGSGRRPRQGGKTTMKDIRPIPATAERKEGGEDWGAVSDIKKRSTDGRKGAAKNRLIRGQSHRNGRQGLPIGGKRVARKCQ